MMRVSEDQSRSNAEEPSLRSLRVFVVENHADTLRYLRLYLEQLGCSVTTASSLGEALDTLPKTECDVLLSDIGLPDGTGWELMERMDRPQPLFAIAMSGYGTTSDLQKSQAVGFRRHLVKPFDPDQLEDILAEAAREREAARA